MFGGGDMTSDRKQNDRPTHTAEAEPTHDGKQPERDNTVAGAGDNRQAGDLDGNRSAGDAKSPGAKSPEVESQAGDHA